LWMLLSCSLVPLKKEVCLSFQTIQASFPFFVFHRLSFADLWSLAHSLQISRRLFFGTLPLTSEAVAPRLFPFPGILVLMTLRLTLCLFFWGNLSRALHFPLPQFVFFLFLWSAFFLLCQTPPDQYHLQLPVRVPLPQFVCLAGEDPPPLVSHPLSPPQILLGHLQCFFPSVPLDPLYSFPFMVSPSFHKFQRHLDSSLL